VVDRRQIRQEKAPPIIATLHDWMSAQRDLVSNESATAKALDYSLKRWVALTNYLDDGALPIDQNKVENQIRPWADANGWRGDADKETSYGHGRHRHVLRQPQPSNAFLQGIPSSLSNICD